MRPKKYTKDFIEKEADALLDFFKKDGEFLVKFCIERGYAAQRLSEFAKESEVFSEALNRAKNIQEYSLMIKGLKSEYNPYFTGLTLKNVAGWRDKSEHTGKDGKDLFPKPLLDGKSNDTANNSNNQTTETESGNESG